MEIWSDGAVSSGKFAEFAEYAASWLAGEPERSRLGGDWLPKSKSDLKENKFTGRKIWKHFKIRFESSFVGWVNL